MLQYPKVLLLSSDAVEADVLQETLSEYVILTCARNRRELKALLGSDNYDVLFCSKSVPDLERRIGRGSATLSKDAGDHPVADDGGATMGRSAGGRL